MVKKIYLLLIFSVFIVASDSFEVNCVSCHTKERVDLRKTFMSALLVYGGEQSFKTALFVYCKNPALMSSVMDEWFLKEHKPPKPIDLDDITLKNMLDIYWDRYKVINKLR